MIYVVHENGILQQWHTDDRILKISSGTSASVESVILTSVLELCSTVRVCIEVHKGKKPLACTLCEKKFGQQCSWKEEPHMSVLYYMYLPQKKSYKHF